MSAFQGLKGQGRLKHGCLVSNHQSKAMLQDWEGVSNFLGQCEWCTGAAQCHGTTVLAGKQCVKEWKLSTFFENGVRGNLQGTIAITAFERPLMRDLHGKVYCSDKTLTKEIGCMVKEKSTEITSYVLSQRNINGAGVLLRVVNEHVVLAIRMKGFGTRLCDTYDKLQPQGALRVEKKHQHFRDVLLFRSQGNRNRAVEESVLQVWVTEEESRLGEDYTLTSLSVKTYRGFDFVPRVPIELSTQTMPFYTQGHQNGFSMGYQAAMEDYMKLWSTQHAASHAEAYGPLHGPPAISFPSMASVFDPMAACALGVVGSKERETKAEVAEPRTEQALSELADFASLGSVWGTTESCVNCFS